MDWRGEEGERSEERKGGGVRRGRGGRKGRERVRQVVDVEVNNHETYQRFSNCFQDLHRLDIR